MTDFENAVTTPQRRFCKREGIPPNMLTALFIARGVDSVVIGGRFRHVIESSWHDYVARRQRRQARKTAERQAEAIGDQSRSRPAPLLYAHWPPSRNLGGPLGTQRQWCAPRRHPGFRGRNARCRAPMPGAGTLAAPSPRRRIPL